MSSTFVLDKKQIAWAFDKWNLGYSYYEIGEALHCSYKTVQRALQRTYGANRRRMKPILSYDFGSNRLE